MISEDYKYLTDQVGRSKEYPWYLNEMVTQNTLRTFEGKQDFSEMKFIDLRPPNLNKCLHLIEILLLLRMSATIFGSPSNAHGNTFY